MSTRKLIIGACLLAAPFFAGAAQAADYSIQSTTGGTVTGSALTSTNVEAVTGSGSFTSSGISAGNGNRISSSAVGASSAASIDVSIPAANIVDVPGAALQVNAVTITANNNANGTVGGGGTFGATTISGGVSNSISSQAIGASAGSGITFRAQ